MKAEIVNDAEDYIYNSARNHAGDKGLLRVVLLDLQTRVLETRASF